MKKFEKLNFLQNNHMGEWLKTRSECLDELSASCSMWCVCGKLCTGLHESYCRRFQDKVTSMTLGKLSHLLKSTTLPSLG